MTRALLGALAIVALACAHGCERRVELGRDALLQVDGAQFVRDAMPGGDGPAVKAVSVSPIVRPGASGRRCSGDLDPTATGVAIGLAGDVGYWVLPAGQPEVAARGNPTFVTQLGFARSMVEGRTELVVRAVDADGRFGPATTKPLTVSSDRPAGRLVVSLAWGNAADLDLHLIDPTGAEVFHRDINSYATPPPGSSPEPPGTSHDGGVLDFDSNALCVQDGRRAENVVYSDPPPAGHYVVRVDTSSLCGEPMARWRVEATLDGATLGGAEGTSTEADLRFPSKRGSGLTVLEFDVP